MAEIDPARNFAVASGEGVRTLRPKSDHRSTLERGIVRAFVTCSAASRPPDIYAAPMIASATSAMAYSCTYEMQEE